MIKETLGSFVKNKELPSVLGFVAVCMYDNARMSLRSTLAAQGIVFHLKPFW